MNRILLRQIVSAVDLSDRSVPTLKRALQLAYLHGGELFVVHVTNGRSASAESETRRSRMRSLRCSGSRTQSRITRLRSALEWRRRSIKNHAAH